MYLKSDLPEVDVPAPVKEEDVRRAKLVHLLRTPSEWPAGFEWDYGSCRTCAIGLLCATTGIAPINQFGGGDLFHTEVSRIGKAVGLTPNQADQCFIYASEPFLTYDEGLTDGVSPERVADLIEHLAPIPAAARQ